MIGLGANERTSGLLDKSGWEVLSIGVVEMDVLGILETDVPRVLATEESGILEMDDVLSLFFGILDSG